MPHTCQWMEKTNVFAKLATDLVLEKAGRFTILPSAILGLPTQALMGGKSVYLPEHAST